MYQTYIGELILRGFFPFKISITVEFFSLRRTYGHKGFPTKQSLAARGTDEPGSRRLASDAAEGSTLAPQSENHAGPMPACDLPPTQRDSGSSWPQTTPPLAPHPGPRPYLAVGSGVDPVVVHPPLVSQRDGPLAGAALALPHQEAAVDAAAQQVLGSVAGHRPVVPGVLLQAVDGRDVVARDPALAVFGLGLTPLPIVIVAQDPELFAFEEKNRVTHTGLLARSFLLGLVRPLEPPESLHFVLASPHKHAHF